MKHFNSRFSCLSLAAAVLLGLSGEAGAYTLAQALNATNLVWTTGGTNVWIAETNITHDGQAAGQSGQITDSQETWVQTQVIGPAMLSFWWKGTRICGPCARCWSVRRS